MRSRILPEAESGWGRHRTGKLSGLLASGSPPIRPRRFAPRAPSPQGEGAVFHALEDGKAKTDYRFPVPSRLMSNGDLLTTDEVLARYSGGPQTGVFTDGGSVPNPGPGGWGAVYVVDGQIVEQARGYDPETTNNRMELTALINACDLVPDQVAVTVYSDSNLAVQSMNEWAKGWERRGWKRKTGPIKNLDLVQELYFKLQSRPELTLRWIRAHDGSLWNEYADSLANAWRRAEL